MKKQLSFLALLTAFILSAFTQQLVTATTVKLGNRTIDTTVYKLEASTFQWVYKNSAGSAVIAVADKVYPEKVLEYTVTEKFDTIVNRANLRGANLLKLLQSKTVYGRDTTIQYAFPLSGWVDLQSVTISGQPSANSQAWRKKLNGNFEKWVFNESVTQFQNRSDSLLNLFTP